MEEEEEGVREKESEENICRVLSVVKNLRGIRGGVWAGGAVG